QGQAGHDHQQHQQGRGQHPGGIARIQARLLLGRRLLGGGGLGGRFPDRGSGVGRGIGGGGDRRGGFLGRRRGGFLRLGGEGGGRQRRNQHHQAHGIEPGLPPGQESRLHGSLRGGLERVRADLAGADADDLLDG